MSTPTISPCLWFDDQAETAADLYTSVFPSSRTSGLSRYPETFDNPSGKPRGSVMSVEFELAGTRFTALNGGPYFTPNPTMSFFANLATADQVDRVATTLAEGGTYLMELDTYPWSPRYAWVQDRFGVSWQVMQATTATDHPKIVPCLMFTGSVHGRAEEALSFYAGTFPAGEVTHVEHYGPGEGPENTLKHGRTHLGDAEVVTMDSHLEHSATFTEAISLQVICDDQAEVDRYWSRLSDGGEEGPCGWLKDRFGVSWQVVPSAFIEMLNSGDGQGPGYERAFKVMLDMKKLDLDALQAAYDGNVESGDAS